MGLHSHFHVQPNFSVEVVFCCVVVGVMTIRDQQPIGSFQVVKNKRRGQTELDTKAPSQSIKFVSVSVA